MIDKIFVTKITHSLIIQDKLFDTFYNAFLLRNDTLGSNNCL